MRHGVEAAKNGYEKVHCHDITSPFWLQVKFLSADYILMPINHLNCHWTLAVGHITFKCMNSTFFYTGHTCCNAKDSVL